MTANDLLSKAEVYAARLEQRCAKYKHIVVYGTSEEAKTILALLTNRDVRSHMMYAVDTADVEEETIESLPVRKQLAEEDGRDCIVLLDYLHVLYAKHILLRNEPSAVVNVFESDGFYDSQTLISDGWMTDPKTDEELILDHNNNINRKMISRFVADADVRGEAIRTIEIETVNRCNGKCSFCPVNAKDDPRKLQFMDQALFQRIVDMLAEAEYAGKLALFSNNEPFLDKRIIEFHKYAREKLPLCRMHLFTNGTLLNLNLFLQIIPYLDELIIDNYSDEAKIPNHLQEIIDYCQEHPALMEKVTVVLRRQNELLSSRGGEASNRCALPDVSGETCALPFQQLIIRPDGKVSLCCNDPLGKFTMGDLNHQTISEIWSGEKFMSVRENLKIGRQMLDKCMKCDAFHYYF